MDTTTTHYETLEVSPNATPEVIQAAFGVIRGRHAINGSQPDPQSLASAAKAFNVLSDPARRADYDDALGFSALETEYQKANTPALVWRNGKGWIPIDLEARFGGSHSENNTRQRAPFPGISHAVVPSIFREAIHRWVEKRKGGVIRK